MTHATTHVPALDGIRALAVAAVLAFHGGMTWASGGFLGVDVFFVLSGYLITALLLAEWHLGSARIDLAAFWGRRARRLLPALLLMVTAVAIGGRALLPPDEVRLLRGDGIAALVYVANWRMIDRDGDYFAQTAAPSPLQHTWSLGIEEQFYLVWPLILCVLLLAGRRARWSPRARLRVLLLVCVVAAVTSATALATTYSPADPGRAYYGTDTRGVSILVGAALATLLALRRTDTRGGRPSRRARRRVGLGFCCAAAGVVVVTAVTRLAGSDEILYRGAMVLVALAVAAVIAHVVVVPTGLSARLLAIPPLPALGAISYGVYLWHWPVFMAASSGRTGLEGTSLFAVRCIVTLGIATASYVVLERPVQRTVHWRRPAVTAVAAGAAIAAGAVVVTVTTTVPPGAAYADESVAATEVERLLGAEGGEATVVEETSPRDTPATQRPRTTPPLRRRAPGEEIVVGVFGDSVAWTLVHYLPDHPELDLRDHTLMGCGISRTAPFRYADRTYDGLMAACRAWPRIRQAAIVRDDPDVVLVLAGRWETMDRVLDGQWTHVGEPRFDAHLRSELDLAIRVAGARGAHVLLATEPYNRRWERLDGSLYPEDEPGRVTAWNELLRSVAADHPGVRVIELGARISPEGRFTWDAGGYQVRSDGLHLTPSGVRGWIAPWLLPQLVDAVPPARARRPMSRARHVGHLT
jgi:peptidoglycan/LPS O-acetylase OafA/YrhL